LEENGRRVLAGTIVDVTDVKRAEESSRASERRLKTAQELANVAFMDWNLETNDIVVSDETRRIYGWDLETKVTADAVAGVVHPDDTEASMQSVSEVLAGEVDSGDLVHRIVRPSGEVRWTRSRTRLVTSPSGARTLMGTVQDITPLATAEREKLELLEQLRQSQKLEAIGRLAAGIAHDFNNHLCAITGLAEMVLLDLDPDTTAAQDVRSITISVDFAARLTRQLLVFSRRQVTSPRPLFIDDAAERSFSMVRRLIGEDVHLHYETSPEPWYVNSMRAISIRSW
jgi:PAS domain S-box-containing protein